MDFTGRNRLPYHVCGHRLPNFLLLSLTSYLSISSRSVLLTPNIFQLCQCEVISHACDRDLASASGPNKRFQELGAGWMTPSFIVGGLGDFPLRFSFITESTRRSRSRQGTSDQRLDGGQETRGATSPFRQWTSVWLRRKKDLI